MTLQLKRVRLSYLQDLTSDVLGKSWLLNLETISKIRKSYQDKTALSKSLITPKHFNSCLTKNQFWSDTKSDEYENLKR